MCLTMFYNGLSFSDLARSLAETYQNPVNRSTVYRWVTKYTQEAIRIHYNFFRPHMALKDKTPAEVAGIKSPYRSWTELVRKTG